MRKWWLDEKMVVGLFSDARDFILLQSFQTVSEAQSAFKSIVIKGFSPQDQAAMV